MFYLPSCNFYPLFVITLVVFLFETVRFLLEEVNFWVLHALLIKGNPNWKRTFILMLALKIWCIEWWCWNLLNVQGCCHSGKYNAVLSPPLNYSYLSVKHTSAGAKHIIFNATLYSMHAES